MPTNSLDIQPTILRWAIKRSGLPESSLRNWNKGLISQWVDGDKKPTLTQLTDFAKKVHVPLGYLFLEKPPEERIPVPDYRTYDDNQPALPSPDLIDTIHEMQRRQDWMRDYLTEIGADKLSFIGSLQETISVEKAAVTIRQDLGFPENWAEDCRTYDDALRKFRNAIDDTGILISIKGCVGMSTKRGLNPEEFCGFVLSDDYAPFIFINGKCPKSAQMFTLAHELAHLWLGVGGLFNLSMEQLSFQHETEQLCNKIAVEFLVPRKKILDLWNNLTQDFRELANQFKVSPIVIARRVFDLNLIDQEHFFSFWRQQKTEWENLKTISDRQKGGNPYRNYRVWLGKRFSEAIISATRSGFLSYKEAFRLSGLRGATFDLYVSKMQGGSLD